MSENPLAIHEAGHAVAFLALGREVDSATIRDDDTGATIPGLSEPEPPKSGAIITLAGPLAELVALEKGLIAKTISPMLAPTSRRAAVEESDDAANYEAAISALMNEQPDSSRAIIDEAIRAETRGIVERHWETVIAIAHAIEASAWESDLFNPRRRTKTLEGAAIEKIFCSANPRCRS